MAKMLWKPSEDKIRNSNMYKFMCFINEKHGTDFKEYLPLYRWSIDNIAEFWASFWDYAGIKCSKTYDNVVDDLTRMPGTKWFEGARLNFAENLLRYRDDHAAFIFRGETQKRKKMSYAELYDSVARLARSLRKIG
ncbi:MAG TPA: acetyl-coenzyme A synthetase N-terminal domain-containing protein, partial [Desulfatiglandales bacterium]|nr:acetyl-coenzyme A synthetase N-terminal domain-containing protein [Desulfatiglandales bacterium]